MYSLDKFDSTVKNSLSFLDNEYVSTGLFVFLILYASVAAPKLPRYVAKLFDNTFFKLVILFLIAYVSRKNPTVALVAALGLMISIMTLNKYELGEMMSVVNKNGENYASEDNMSYQQEAINDYKNDIVKNEYNNAVRQQEQLQEQEQEQEHELVHEQDYEPARVPVYEPEHEPVESEYEPVQEQTMDDKIIKVIEQVKEVEEQTGKPINETELRSLCATVSDEHTFSMGSLMDLNEAKKPARGKVPEAYVQADNTYASV